MKLIFILSTLILINSQKEKTEKQIRADACIKILKSRMNQDSEYIKHFIEFLTPKFNNNQNDAMNRLISFAMLSCYDKINYYDADSIATSPVEINSLETTNKDLLSLEKWEMLFKENDEQRLNYEMSLLSSSVSDFQSGQVDLSALSQSQPNRNQNYDDVQEGNEQMGNFYTRNENDFDLNIFGFNLKNISQMWKNVIGIGLICIVFESILIGMKWINIIREERKNKKKKKKKK
jgi:hypothetical protein